jgi:hypothetical protein
VASNFFSSWDECPTNLWTLTTFSNPANMTREDLTSPVSAAATAQVKLCPYNEEEPHIWFHLIEGPRPSLQQQESNHKNLNMAMLLPPA